MSNIATWKSKQKFKWNLVKSVISNLKVKVKRIYKLKQDSKGTESFFYNFKCEIHIIKKQMWNNLRQSRRNPPRRKLKKAVITSGNLSRDVMTK